MNEEKQRVEIAEACGWELVSNGINPMWSWQNTAADKPQRIKWAAHKDMAAQGVLPDYLNDLNAMHEAESHFEGDLRFNVSVYMSHIAAIILRQAGLRPDGHCGSYRIVHATAKQRAEAFLKTIGKWKDEQ